MSGTTSKMLHGNTTRQVLCGTFKTRNEYRRSVSISFRLFRCVISEFIRFIHGLAYVEADVTGKKEYKLAKSGSKQQPNMIVGYKKNVLLSKSCNSTANPPIDVAASYSAVFLMIHRMSHGSECPLVFCGTK